MVAPPHEPLAYHHMCDLHGRLPQATIQNVPLLLFTQKQQTPAHTCSVLAEEPNPEFALQPCLVLAKIHPFS